jgi:hypothetical protein
MWRLVLGAGCFPRRDGSLKSQNALVGVFKIERPDCKTSKMKNEPKTA